MKKNQNFVLGIALFFFIVSILAVPWKTESVYLNYKGAIYQKSRSTVYSPIWSPPTMYGDEGSVAIVWGSLLGTWFTIGVIAGIVLFILNTRSHA